MFNQETIDNLIKAFHLAVTYLRIYPPSSQMVVATVDTFFKTLEELFEKTKSVTFSEHGGKLLVEGNEPDSREIQLIGHNLLKLFSQKKIQSITLNAGLTKEELTAFLMNILKKKRDELPASPHIALDQTVYIAMVKGEQAVVRITEMVQNSRGEIVGLIKTLRESYDLIDQIPEPDTRSMAQDRLAQELAKQDTNVLRDIFERELPPRIEESGLKPKVLNALSQDKIQGIFGDISSWYEEIRKKEGSDFAAVEQLGKLKQFIQTILSAPASREIPRQFFEDLIRKGFIDQMPEWFSAEQAKPATVFEIEQLLEKPAVHLIEKEAMENLPQLAEKLCRIENNDLLGRLTEKMLENIHNPAAQVRLPAAQSLLAVHNILQANSREPLLRYMELPLIEAMKQESMPEVHAQLCEILRQRARQDLLHGEYDLSLRIIDLFRQHAAEETTQDARIRAGATAALDRLVPETIDLLVADMKSDNEKKRLGSLQLLTKIGTRALDPLIRVIKESEDLHSRRLAASALQHFGQAAQKRFMEELHLGQSADEIKRIVGALGELGCDETTERLNALLCYPDASVKKEIMKFLARLGSSQAKLLLIGQLEDADPSVSSEAVRLLRELKCAEAVEPLTRLLNSGKTPPALREEICIALGTIGTPQAVPVLISQLRKKPFRLFASNDNERIRIRAAWSLRKFTGHEVEQALVNATRDKSTSIALTARESLAFLRSAGSSKGE